MWAVAQWQDGWGCWRIVEGWKGALGHEGLLTLSVYCTIDLEVVTMGAKVSTASVPIPTTLLSSSSDRWRIRVGEYCVIYRIDNTAGEVVVLRIAHRRQAYR